MMKPIFSLILPVFNEEETLEETYRRVAAVVDKLDGEGEIIMVDDGSRDHSLQMMRELRQRATALQLDSLVEVHTEKELEAAVKAKPESLIHVLFNHNDFITIR